MHTARDSENTHGQIKWYVCSGLLSKRTLTQLLDGVGNMTFIELWLKVWILSGLFYAP